MGNGENISIIAGSSTDLDREEWKWEEAWGRDHPRAS